VQQNTRKDPVSAQCVFSVSVFVIIVLTGSGFHLSY